MRPELHLLVLASGLLGLALLESGGPPAFAAEPCPLPVGVRCCCLVRFCPKPLPCLPRPFLCGCCPSYEGKPLPTTCPVCCRQPVSYCPKPLPCPPTPVGCAAPCP
jgi:hypothetical protein